MAREHETFRRSNSALELLSVLATLHPMTHRNTTDRRWGFLARAMFDLEGRGPAMSQPSDIFIQSFGHADDSLDVRITIARWFSDGRRMEDQNAAYTPLILPASGVVAAIRDIWEHTLVDGRRIACVTPYSRDIAIAAMREEHLLPDNSLDSLALAILADSLEESGCIDEVILKHLRASCPFCLDADFKTGDSGTPMGYRETSRGLQDRCSCGGSRLHKHWRGCWAVHSVLAAKTE